ncbi:MAG: hypothetical protein IJ233_07010, partial [Pyramidobacter sp.]|nr:hypothetical protein [Pyramidobacter sp.]
MSYGTGKYTYECDTAWAKGVIEKYGIAVVAGVTVDEQDNVYVLTRSDPPVIILDRQGRELETFCSGIFGRADGMFRDRDGSLFGVDDARQAVYKFNVK